MAVASRMAASATTRLAYKKATTENDTHLGMPQQHLLLASDPTTTTSGYHLVPEDDDPCDDASVTYNRTVPFLQSGGLDEEVTWQEKLHRVLSASVFQMTVAALIIANSIVIGAETNQPELQCWNIIEHVFLLLFAVEITLNAIARPSGFWNLQDTDFFWNLFDIFVVAFGLVDYAVTYSSSRDGRSFATAFRIIRLARILRIFRLVRFLRQLYMLVFGFGMAAVAVFWVTVMMTLVLYVSSIVLVRTLGCVGEDDPNYEVLHEHFGSLGSAMLTLFTLMAVPDLDPYKDVLITHPGFLVFCVLYTIFGSFGLIGLLTGVIMESMYEKNDVRREEGQKDAEEKRRELVSMLEHLFDQSPKMSNGDLAIETVAELVPEITSQLRLQGYYLTPDDTKSLADVMDVDQSGSVSRSEFSEFIISVTEGVRPMMILKVNHAVAAARRSVEEASQKHSREMASLKAVLADALAKLDAHTSQSSCTQNNLHSLSAFAVVPRQEHALQGAAGQQEHLTESQTSSEYETLASWIPVASSEDAGRLAAVHVATPETIATTTIERTLTSVRSAPQNMWLSREHSQATPVVPATSMAGSNQS
eukprot:TRINITY_DN75056_c0_g1_i1.p1 TRINITY_DN75056_c0_g1~~TRINITY_DN75056_c0_g1_i1.p1  ORF type:complete len:590 (-),score=87.61 TRINITY_DN75056_c0_g1_i1:49-1818(-)